MVKLDIISDPVCPWCYIGKANLDRALSAHPDHPFVIEWHPFQLNPDMPAEGMDRREYLETKFGGKEKAAAIYARIDEGRQTAVVSTLFRAYFIEGRDIGDIDVLSDVADSCGLDAAMTRQLLQGDADRDDIGARDRHSREMGVTGVPTFVIASQHAVPGAQPAELWGQVIEEIMSQTEDTDE